MWPRRKPDMVIYRGDKPYIRRWFLLPRNRWFNAYLHQGLLSDYFTPHDHPWWNASFILKGRYYEFQYNIVNGGLRLKTFDRECFSFVFRKATQLHRIQLDSDKPFWSLFITGPTIRDWGFQTHNGWVSHTKVLDIDRVRGTSKIKPDYEKNWQ